jgi:hypothetical protein
VDLHVSHKRRSGGSRPSKEIACGASGLARLHHLHNVVSESSVAPALLVEHCGAVVDGNCQ